MECQQEPRDRPEPSVRPHRSPGDDLMTSPDDPTSDQPHPAAGDLDARKAAILNAVVSEYIGSAQPVGSQHVVDAPGVSVSSATVRSDMAALERDGYLAQPHTSAGRIPTDKGYRFFVDQLGGPGPLDPGGRQQVRQFFDHAHGEIEQMLERTSGLLADLTDCTAMVVGPPWWWWSWPTAPCRSSRSSCPKMPTTSSWPRRAVAWPPMPSVPRWPRWVRRPRPAVRLRSTRWSPPACRPCTRWARRTDTTSSSSAARRGWRPPSMRSTPSGRC